MGWVLGLMKHQGKSGTANFTLSIQVPNRLIKCFFWIWSIKGITEGDIKNKNVLKEKFDQLRIKRKGKENRKGSVDRRDKGTT